MNLSAEHITKIKSWISKRGFTHTDVQYEIIDHVASAIEAKMEKNPDLQLEDAFEEVHRSFGVYGFAEVEEAITSRLNKELLNSYWSAAKEILLSSKVLILLLIFFLVNLISQQFPQYFDKIILSALIVFCTFTFVYAFAKRKNKKHLKSYLSFKMASGIIPLITVVIFNLRYLYLDLLNPLWTAVSISILAAAIWAVFIGSTQMITKTEKLHKLYQ